MRNDTKFCIDESLYNRNFRNCLAHYGLGQFLKENDVVSNDILKGLTYRAFRLDYFSAKEQLYKILCGLADQIGESILEMA